ncbi:unnamed protein product [Ambrosiozyma monospora]|uniref:Unnamed protein product n=1 Tax=Ambrosiozyma monospora TaxID=43982 RepID=A0ACB5U4Z6_AMBMO|nr:unnamed protein product [Ambrosiozyma monospora]
MIQPKRFYLWEFQKLIDSSLNCHQRLNQEKVLFHLTSSRASIHTHTSAEIIEKGKLIWPKRLQEHFQDNSRKKNPCPFVNISEDDRFKIELPSNLVWAEFIPYLYQLKSEALESIHQTS